MPKPEISFCPSPTLTSARATLFSRPFQQIIMNVAFEPLPNCLANLRIEVDAPDVQKKMGEITSQYAKQARLPGFRQGKAPRSVVERKFTKEIREEVTKQVLSDACRSAIEERKLRV